MAETMKPDDDLRNADWAKQTADFPGDSPADLVAFCRRMGISVDRFLKSPGGSRLPERFKARMRELA